MHWPKLIYLTMLSVGLDLELLLNGRKTFPVRLQHKFLQSHRQKRKIDSFIGSIILFQSNWPSHVPQTPNMPKIFTLAVLPALNTHQVTTRPTLLFLQVFASSHFLIEPSLVSLFRSSTPFPTLFFLSTYCYLTYHVCFIPL